MKKWNERVAQSSGVQVDHSDIVHCWLPLLKCKLINMSVLHGFPLSV